MPNSYDFAGRTALVTGGASGIGAATAARLRASGAEVAVFDREPVEGYVAGTGVLVNCIAPAVIETPILAGLSQDHIDYMVERIPLGRMGRTEEVAALIAFLASEDLSFATGATYDISGGRAVY